jgi:hypothetical protein
MNQTVFGSVFKWFGFQMVGFMIMKWSKPDWQLNSHSISSPVIKWLQQKGGREWSVIRMVRSS